MTIPRKPVIISLLVIAGIVTGFIFLLKGCLAKYDERSVKTPALVFEKKGKISVFGIVEFQKTSSYSQKGGMVNKTVNTNYYIQSNDGITAAMLLSKKIKNHLAIKNFPVEVLGASGELAWVFMGELMAFDPFSLEMKANKLILEEKNPVLKSKFPAERQYYRFNRHDQQIYFTATDGSKWKLNTVSLTATPAVYNNNESPLQTAITNLDRRSKNINDEIDSLYQQKSKRASAAYAAKQISYAEYRQSLDEYYERSRSWRDIKDSVDAERRKLEAMKRKNDDIERTIDNLQHAGISFSSLKSNQDTLSPNWLGLYSAEELNKISDRVSSQTIPDETARRSLFSAEYMIGKNGEFLFNKAAVKNSSPESYLDGGFLIDKATAKPFYLSNQSLLIVHKDQVGKEGNILITRIARDGKQGWTCNTKLAGWSDWIFSCNRLYVFGVTNKNLSSNESNLLLCIDLQHGTAAKYDYFTQKKTE